MCQVVSYIGPPINDKRIVVALQLFCVRLKHYVTEPKAGSVEDGSNYDIQMLAASSDSSY